MNVIQWGGLRCVIVIVCVVWMLFRSSSAYGHKKSNPSARALRSQLRICEREFCLKLFAEERRACTLRCVSKQCYDEIYAPEPVNHDPTP